MSAKHPFARKAQAILDSEALLKPDYLKDSLFDLSCLLREQSEVEQREATEFDADPKSVEYVPHERYRHTECFGSEITKFS